MDTEGMLPQMNSIGSDEANGNSLEVGDNDMPTVESPELENRDRFHVATDEVHPTLSNDVDRDFGQALSSQEEDKETEGKQDQAAVEEPTSYIASCVDQVQRIGKRKRDLDDQVNSIVDDTVHRLEALINNLLEVVQQRQRQSRDRFDDATENLMIDLRAHNQTEKKLRAIAAILQEEE